nr:radical SAM protein [uncultured Duganella sp.]
MNIPITKHVNYTIIVNWKERGFGCAKACTYCNWRGSPMLPQGAQSVEQVRSFIQKCDKSFITISGGGDPLYRLDEHFPALRTMADTIKAEGYEVRVITREVPHVARLKGIADHVSISLDDDVLQQLDHHQQDWDSAGLNLDIEFSLVLPPLSMADLLELKPQYAALHRRLRRRLVLRENFNSIFPVDAARMSFGHSGIVFVPKSLCLNSRYLANVECSGHEIVQDNAALTGFLMAHPDAYLFGGFVKHLIEPTVHLEYNDIDVIALNTGVMDSLSGQYGFSFKEVSPEGAYPRYFVGKSVRAGKSIQIILMHSAADAKRFIFNAQYAVDRVGFNKGFFFDPVIGEDAIHDAIRHKVAQTAPGTRSLELFQPDRLQVEQRHKSKLVKKGFLIASH